MLSGRILTLGELIEAGRHPNQIGISERNYLIYLSGKEFENAKCENPGHFTSRDFKGYILPVWFLEFND